MAKASGLLFEKDVAVPVGDGNVLRANVFRPEAPGTYPVVMAQGIYGKDVHFADAFKPQWTRLLQLYPGLCDADVDDASQPTGARSSGRYLRWETVDPERWVPDGYVVIQVDARGTGKSPGFLDPYSPREIQDYYDAIEWAASQPWSNGKVGLIGVSYYAITQWLVAALRPPHLAAIVPWEGACDHYRDWSRHGGMLSGFAAAWWPRQVLVNQHGNADTAHRDRDTGERTTGAPLDAAMLAGNRSDYPGDLARHALDDEWHRDRTPDLSRVEVPVLSAGNWGGPGVHLRGNIEGWMRSASESKWLSMHTGTHYESFYLPQYVAMQKRFFDRYLKDLDNGWDDEPNVQLSIRRPDGATRRMEREFPLARTQWMRFHLDAKNLRIQHGNPEAQTSVSYGADGVGVSFTTEAFDADVEFTGFVTLRLWVSSTATDMDLFASLRAFDAAGKEVIFDGAHEPTPVSRGWLRASHRALDPERSTPTRLWHAHREPTTLEPGTLYPVDIEIWPTCMVFLQGYRLALTIQGRDFEFAGTPGRILHDHADDRPASVRGATHTIATGADHASYLVLPVIPAA